jgi:exopolysaccharide biosynthesis WecB/TagA/CpsF family protein
MAKILNINILDITLGELLKSLKKGVLVTPNVDHLVKLQKDRTFYQSYQKAEWVVCDSKIIALTSRILKTPIRNVIAGSNFFPRFCDYHKNNDTIKIFLLGTKQIIANEAMRKINERIGRKIVVDVHSPSFGFEKNNEECEYIVDLINSSDANVLVVGVGAPKQEKWIYKYREKLFHIDIFMALGAIIDFEAFHIKRAPKIYQLMALEWLYRLSQEPRRLWKRYLVDDIPFFYYILKQKFGYYKNPFVK